MTWPRDADSLVALQQQLAARDPVPWRPPPREQPSEPLRVGGCWACFPRGISGPGAAGDRAWVAGVVMVEDEVVDGRATTGVADAPYRAGLLALRVGRLLEEVVRALATVPDVLVLDASGRDHPRQAGLAVHLGAELDVPTVGVTHRPLAGHGPWPEDRRGATSPVLVADAVVASWVRIRPGVRPLVVHPGWRVELSTAVDVVLDVSARHRTPEPLRRARELARGARAAG